MGSTWHLPLGDSSKLRTLRFVSVSQGWTAEVALEGKGLRWVQQCGMGWSVFVGVR